MADSRHQIFEVIRNRGPISLKEIVEQTGLSRATVTDLLGKLRDRGAVVVVDAGRGEARAGTGRPPHLYSVNPELAIVVGLHFEHGLIRAAVADLGLRMIAQSIRTTPVAGDFSNALGVAAAMVSEIVGRAGVTRQRLLGAAISLPAPIDRVNGRVLATTILPDWVGRRPAAELEKRLQVPVDVDNDATLAGFGEVMAGAAQGCRHVVYVKASAAIGCGIVIDGRPYHGAFGSAGELAHVMVVSDGELCFCGNRGCLLTVTGGQHIVERLESIRSLSFQQRRQTEGAGIDEHLEQVVRRAQQGDVACQRVLFDAVGHLAVALADVCNLINPERLVIGGILGGAGELLLGPLRDRVLEATRALSPKPVDVVPSELGEWAEVLGAMALVQRGPRTDLNRRLHVLLD